MGRTAPLPGMKLDGPHSWSIHCGPINESAAPESITSSCVPKAWVASILERESQDQTTPVWAPSWVAAMTTFGGDANFRQGFKERPNTFALVAALLLTVSIPASLNPELRTPPDHEVSQTHRDAMVEAHQALMAMSTVLSMTTILVASKTTDILTIDLPSPKDAVWWWNTGLVNWPMGLLVLDLGLFFSAYVVAFVLAASLKVVVSALSMSVLICLWPICRLIYWGILALRRHQLKYSSQKAKAAV